MKITIVGTGYVGLVTGTCLADIGNDVLCLDVDAAQDRRAQRRPHPDLRAGPGGHRAAQRAPPGACASRPTWRPAWHTASCSSSPSARRPRRTAAPTCSYVLAAARTIGRAHGRATRSIVNKTTVPVGTADQVRAVIAEALAERGREHRVQRRLQPGVPQGGRGGRGLHAARPHRHRRRRRARDAADARALRALPAQPRARDA